MARLLLFCLILLGLASCQSEVRYAAADATYHPGDDPRWATRQYDDSHWRPERGVVGPQVFWSRSWVTLHQRPPPLPARLAG